MPTRADTSLPPVRLAWTTKLWTCVQWDNWLDSCQQLVYWIWLTLHVFLMVGTSGLKPPYMLRLWCKWSSFQFSEGSNAFDWHHNLIPAVMLKKWKCESVRTSYWIHTWGNGVVFWQWNKSVVTSASISVSAVVYYRFKRLIVDIADMSSKGPGFAYQHVWESRPCHKLPSSHLCVDLRAEIICPDLNQSLFWVKLVTVSS